MECSHYKGYIMGCGDSQYCGVCKIEALTKHVDQLQTQYLELSAKCEAYKKALVEYKTDIEAIEEDYVHD